MWNVSPRQVALISVLAAGFALGLALISEYWGGLVPCALCLWERWPYRIAIALGVLAFVLPGRVALILVMLAMLAAAGLAFVHVGVEEGFWPSPLPECAASSTVVSGSIADRLAAMPALPAKPCDEPTYLIPGLKLSMAAMNLIFSLAFFAMLGGFLYQEQNSRK